MVWRGDEPEFSPGDQPIVSQGGDIKINGSVPLAGYGPAKGADLCTLEISCNSEISPGTTRI